MDISTYLSLIHICSDLTYEVGTMIEIPRAALTADEIAKEADFFCFGTNDLTPVSYTHLAMLKKIGSNARYELEQMLDAKVNLKLWVKVRKDWRDSDFMIKMCIRDRHLMKGLL